MITLTGEFAVTTFTEGATLALFIGTASAARLAAKDLALAGVRVKVVSTSTLTQGTLDEYGNFAGLPTEEATADAAVNYTDDVDDDCDF